MQVPGLRIDAPLDGLPWRPTHHEGVEWIDLTAVGGDSCSDPGSAQQQDSEPAGDTSPSMTVLIRMAPGRGYPRHRHLGPEDVLVLGGGYQDGDGQRFTAGSFVRYPAGSEHEPVALGNAGEPPSEDNPACVLFAVAHGGTELVEAPRAADESRVSGGEGA